MGIRLRVPAWLWLATALSAGCVSNVRMAESPPRAPTEPFSKFRAIVLEHVTVCDALAARPANRRAATRLDDVLFNEMRRLFPNKLLDANKAAAEKAVSGKYVVVEPSIIEADFVNRGTRWLLRSFAGNSAVLVKVVFRDEKGTVIAEPEFRRESALSVGMDDSMLADVAREIARYVAANQ